MEVSPDFSIFDYFTLDGPRKHCNQVRICFYAYISFLKKSCNIAARQDIIFGFNSYFLFLECLRTHFLLLLGFVS